MHVCQSLYSRRGARAQFVCNEYRAAVTAFPCNPDLGSAHAILLLLWLSDAEFRKKRPIANHDGFPLQGGQNSQADAVLKGVWIHRLNIFLLREANDRTAQRML